MIRRWLERHRLIADGHAIYEAGKAMGVAEERYRLLRDGEFGPDELAACRAALDQAERAGEEIGRAA